MEIWRGGRERKRRPKNIYGIEEKRI